jgi:hypothetical protein
VWPDARALIDKGKRRVFTFGRKGRMTKIKRELRLRSAVTSSATSSPSIAWAAYRENSREDG